MKKYQCLDCKKIYSSNVAFCRICCCVEFRTIPGVSQPENKNVYTDAGGQDESADNDARNRDG